MQFEYFLELLFEFIFTAAEYTNAAADCKISGDNLRIE